MNVEEFIDWLKTQDPKATVQVLIGEQGRNYQDDTYRFVEFNPKLSYFIDLTGNKFCNPPRTDKFLELGELA